MNDQDLLSELNFIKSSIMLLQSKTINQLDDNIKIKSIFDDFENRLKVIEEKDEEDTAVDEDAGIKREELQLIHAKVIGGNLEIGYNIDKSYV